jgi:hypothetical protein
MFIFSVPPGQKQLSAYAHWGGGGIKLNFFLKQFPLLNYFWVQQKAF